MTVNRPVPLLTTPMRMRIKRAEMPNNADCFEDDQFEDCRIGNCGHDCPYCDELEEVEEIAEERQHVIDTILFANGFEDEFVNCSQYENTMNHDKYVILNDAYACLYRYYEAFCRGHCLGLAKQMYTDLPLRDVLRLWCGRDLGLRKVLYLIEYWEQKYLTERMFSEMLTLAGRKPEEIQAWEEAEKL